MKTFIMRLQVSTLCLVLLWCKPPCASERDGPGQDSIPAHIQAIIDSIEADSPTRRMGRQRATALVQEHGVLPLLGLFWLPETREAISAARTRLSPSIHPNALDSVLTDAQVDTLIQTVGLIFAELPMECRDSVPRDLVSWADRVECLLILDKLEPIVLDEILQLYGGPPLKPYSDLEARGAQWFYAAAADLSGDKSFRCGELVIRAATEAVKRRQQPH